MKIKKYVVKSVDEALSQIKRDLGPEAYILSTRQVTRRGALDLGGSKAVEVTAAVDRQQESSLSAALLEKKYAFSSDFRSERPAEARNNLSGLAELRAELLPLRSEMEEIRLLLRQAGLDAGNGSAAGLQGLYLECYLELLSREVEEVLARRMVNALQQSVSGPGLPDRESLRQKLFKIMVAALQNPAPLKLVRGQGKVVVLVGPTGVGKTTTIAKLASYFHLLEGYRAALLSLDSYRIGAEEHLRTYAEIIGLPFMPLRNRSDLGLALERFREQDVLFVDTTGRGVADENELAATADVLKAVPEERREVCLVVSATTRRADLHRIMKGFSIFQPRRIIVCKLDETALPGNVFSMKATAGIPGAYFTTGQKVPGDIEVANPRKLVRLVLGDLQ